MGEVHRIYVDVPSDAPGFDSLFDAVCTAEQTWATEDRDWDPMVYSRIVTDGSDDESVTGALAQVIGDWQALAQQHPEMRDLTFMTVADMITAVEHALPAAIARGNATSAALR